MRTLHLLKMAALTFGLSVASVCSFAVSQESAPNPQQPAPLIVPAPAQPEQAASQGTSQGASIEQELQLTQDQKEKIAAVVDEENQQTAALNNDSSLTLEQKQQKVSEIRQAGVPRMKAVLTQEQLQRLDAIVQQRQQTAPQTAPENSPQH